MPNNPPPKPTTPPAAPKPPAGPSSPKPPPGPKTELRHGSDCRADYIAAHVEVGSILRGRTTATDCPHEVAA